VTLIDVLPDDVLLEIFDFCAGEDRSQRFIFFEKRKEIEAWQTLVHVCRRWRAVVFGSPLRLKLALLCTAKTPTRDALDVWPPLPLVIWSPGHYRTESVDNIIAVLERRDRVCQIGLMNIDSYLVELLAAPFPELTHLWLSSPGVIPDSFLGGSAPRLQYISLKFISFPGLPKLLLSSTHLVDLDYCNIPHSGYISPEAMATTLATLTCLRNLALDFQSPQSFPDQESRHPPPLTRFVLPVLTYFMFKGASAYLECLVARIDVPQLNRLSITFFNQIVFDTPQFIQLVDRTPTLKALEKAHITFGDHAASVNLSLVSSLTPLFEGLNVKIPCMELDRQVSSLEQICTSSLPPLSTLEVLYIHNASYSRPHWQDNTENALWLGLLRPFFAVKNLYLCKEFASRIVPALQELVGVRTTEVLPTLQNIFLEELQASGPIQEAIRQFVAVRQVTSRPIAVSLWENSQQDP
jgi:F-box-like